MPILNLPSGRHTTIVSDFINNNINEPNVRITGEGPGNTFIDVPVMATRWGFQLENVTLNHPDNPPVVDAPMLYLRNVTHFLVSNVRVNIPKKYISETKKYDTGYGIVVETTLEGTPLQSLNNNGWPFSGDEPSFEQARSSVGSFINTYVTGYGSGWIFSGVDYPGSFMNNITLVGGHTMSRQLTPPNNAKAPAFLFHNCNNISSYGHQVDADYNHGVWVYDNSKTSKIEFDGATIENNYYTQSSVPRRKPVICGDNLDVIQRIPVNNKHRDLHRLDRNGTFPDDKTMNQLIDEFLSGCPWRI